MRKRMIEDTFSLSDISNLSMVDKDKIANSSVAPSPQDILEQRELRGLIMDVLDQIDSRVAKPNEVFMCPSNPYCVCEHR